MKRIVIAAMLTTSALGTSGRTTELRITVYDRAKLPRALSQSTLQELHQIFRASEIEVRLRWETSPPTRHR